MVDPERGLSWADDEAPLVEWYGRRRLRNCVREQMCTIRGLSEGRCLAL